MPDSTPSRFSLLLVCGACVLVWLVCASDYARLLDIFAHHEPSAYLTQNDAGHYYRYASAHAQGDFSFSYVVNKGERQPLYILLLAGVMASGGGDVATLAGVNVALKVIAALLAAFMVWRLFGAPVAALLTAGWMATFHFFERMGLRLLTEPLFTVTLFGMLYCFVRCLQAMRRDGAVTTWLCAATVFGCLGYLKRPNGLLVTALMWLTVLAWAVALRLRGRRLAWRRLAKGFLAAGALFVLVGALSWAPRVYYHGDPFHFANLPNFMWTDSYEEGLNRDIRLTMGDYLRDHDLGDVWERFTHGLRRCYIQYVKSDFGPLAGVLMLAGLVLAAIQRRWELLAAAAWLFVAMLPLVWTNLSNPSARIPLAQLMPFGVLYLGCLLATGERLVRRLADSRRVEVSMVEQTPR